MWFEAMHDSWQVALRPQQATLEAIEANLKHLPNLTPSSDKVMRAFEQPINQVRVLLVGQDPYPEESVACGLAFAIDSSATKLPASLRNIVKELQSDLPNTPNGGRIESWQSHGVMLLNRHLTTLVGQSNAHDRAGWQGFTEAVIRALVEQRRGKFVALLWGNRAQELTPLLVGVPQVRGVHPSPLSAHRGFFGSKPFSAVNTELQKLGEPPIDWSC